MRQALVYSARAPSSRQAGGARLVVQISPAALCCPSYPVTKRFGLDYSKYMYSFSSYVAPGLHSRPSTAARGRLARRPAPPLPQPAAFSGGHARRRPARRPAPTDRADFSKCPGRAIPQLS